MHRRGAEERIRQRGLSLPARRRQVAHRLRHLRSGDLLLVDEEDAGARRGPRPRAVGSPEVRRYRRGGRRRVGLHESALDEQERPHRIARQEHVGLRLPRLGDEPIDHPGALGFLGVVDRKHLRARSLLEFLEDGLGKWLVHAGVDDHLVRAALAGEAQQHGCRDQDAAPHGFPSCLSAAWSAS